MGREDRQDINKRLKRPAGSDVPPRGKGVGADNASGKPEKATGSASPQKPKGYKGEHRK